LITLYDRYDKSGNRYEYKQRNSFCAHKFSKADDPGRLYFPVVVVPETWKFMKYPIGIADMLIKVRITLI